MLLAGGDLDLCPRAADVLAAAGDARLKPELPAAQLECATDPAPTVAAAARQLGEGRERVAAAAAGIGIPAAAGTHPFAHAEGELNTGARYRELSEEYGLAARRQLVCGLHVHVRVAGAERAVAVHDALRSYLPEIAALAANAPFHEGRDTGFASIRPKIAEQLPRQGVPPALGSIAALARALAWGARAGTVPEPRRWWWELRLHPVFGTVEVRVADQQTTVAHSAAIAAVVQALVVGLAERHAAGDRLGVHPAWKIAENRWSAARHGLDGSLADLDTGAPRPARERVRGLLAKLAPIAERLGAGAQLDTAEELVRANGAERQRAAAAGDPHRAARWLADRFLG